MSKKKSSTVTPEKIDLAAELAKPKAKRMEPAPNPKWGEPTPHPKRKAKGKDAAANDVQPPEEVVVQAEEPPTVPQEAEGIEPKGISIIQGGKPTQTIPAPKTPPVNKRLTPGAHVAEWRIARSLRVGKHGWFLQGGYIEMKAGRKMYRVAEEEFFKTLDKAKEALVKKYPEAIPVGSAVAVDDPAEVKQAN